MTSPVQEMISSEMAEMKSMEESNDPALDLKLCNDSDGQKESSPAASQSSNEVGVEVEAEAVVVAAPPSGEERKSYYCKYCKKKFSNSQALGGHQNAHKRERAVAKTEKGLLEAARASIERCLYPFSTISAYSSGYGAASFSSLLGVQRQSLIHKPGYHGGIGYSGTTGGWPGYSNHNRPFPVTNRPAPMVLMNNYWGRDGILGGGGVGGYQPSPPPPPPPQARPFNIGGYQPAPPPSASNVWAVGASRPADRRPGGALLQFQRQEAQVGVPATEKQIAPAIDLTLKL